MALTSTINVVTPWGSREIRLIVHKSIDGLNSAQRKDVAKRGPSVGPYVRSAGLVQRYQRFSSEGEECAEVATIRLAEGHLNVEIISHEATHAATWLWELDHEPADGPIGTNRDEPLATYVGEITHQIYLRLWDGKLLD